MHALFRTLRLGSLAMALAAPAAGRAAGDQGFVPLFPADGSPAGWTVRQWDDVSREADGAWTVRDGVLIGDQPRGTWLMSDRQYGDFELRFEFKLGPLGNSGLALRAPMNGDPAFDGMELQMADVRYNPAAKDSELAGGLYRAVAPRRQLYQPEAWNRYELKLQGPRFTAKLNGELIHDIDLSQQTEPIQRHDGTDAPPLKDRPRRGHIGFQNLSRGEGEEGRVLIRGTEIRPLD
ncbi:MAG: hypothetical protein DCC67_09015 [Planctomycetota bacterium]|nr:MAG: hypothetical protein DCC67_09015 [Planctomycetota bacterium]